jgi:hypothetical protein
MMTETERFIRIAARSAGGTKLAGRRDVNPALSFEQWIDSDRFLRQLEDRFGDPDHIGDERYWYAIQDTLTGVKFAAYSAQSGPSYGGDPQESYVDFENNDYQLKPDVLRTLRDFDAWLEESSL